MSVMTFVKRVAIPYLSTRAQAKSFWLRAIAIPCASVINLVVAPHQVSILGPNKSHHTMFS